VVFLDVDSMDATALGIALNRTADLAGWDDEILAKLLTQLAADDALEGVGFTEEQLGLLLRSLEDEPTLADPGPSEPPENPVSRTGDLWLLGDHRLLCGDSTSPEDMSRLMGDTKASLLATDPPYLVDYQGEGWDGYEGDDAGVAFFRRFLSVALAHCRKDVPIYHWHAHRRQKLVEEAWEAEGLLMHQQIIWAKSRGTLGRSHFMWAHEPCFYGWRQGSMPVKERRPPASETTVWDIGQAGQQDTDHPTQKPLEVFLKPMRFHTLPGEVVLEPFSGSGSQLMAAEQLGRACYAMEMNAAYVDVAVERWQKATGKQAKLESGVSFAEVAAERSQDED
jgi:DNA modification methylase